MNVMMHFILWKVGLAKPKTYYSDEACKVLKKYAKNKKSLVEIGCWHGVNTKRIRSAMSSEGIFYAIDPYPAGKLGFNSAEVIAHSEVEKVLNGNIKWLKLTEQEAARNFRQKGDIRFDFIFSDAENSYEGFKVMWDVWSELLQEGGIIILANSQSVPGRGIESAGSVRFTREVILKDTRFEYLENIETFTILRKK